MKQPVILSWCELGSDTIIKLCAGLNSELTCPEPMSDIQARLHYIVEKRFSEAQRNQIFSAFEAHKEKAGNCFRGMIFFRRYLVAMLLRELNDYRIIDKEDDHPQQEFEFFIAYLKIID